MSLHSLDYAHTALGLGRRYGAQPRRTGLHTESTHFLPLSCPSALIPLFQTFVFCFVLFYNLSMEFSPISCLWHSFPKPCPGHSYHKMVSLTGHHLPTLLLSFPHHTANSARVRVSSPTALNYLFVIGSWQNHSECLPLSPEAICDGACTKAFPIIFHFSI